MGSNYSLRVRTGITLLVSFALLSSYQTLSNKMGFDFSTIGQDDVSRYERRFDAVRKHLPSSGTVGYTSAIAESTLDPNSHLDPEGLRNWFLTQYTLAPLIISPTPGHKLFIRNGRAPQGEEEYQGVKSRVIGEGTRELDFGNGIRLLTSEF